jgi:hypothetical protein
MDIKYIDHPCSTAVKREWNKKGFRVVDSKFAPVEQKAPKVFPKIKQEKPKRE